MAEDTDRERAEARLSTRMRLLDQGLRALRGCQSVAGRASLAGLRAFMPALELYSGTRAATFATRMEETGEPAEEAGGVGGLTPGETAVLRAAGGRAVLELMEISSVTHPVYEGAPRFRAVSSDGVVQAPHLVHVLALAAAVKAHFGDDEEEPAPDDGGQRPNPSQTVAYVSVAPGEYAVVSGPLAPQEIRRFSMRQRRQTQPQLAMRASTSDPSAVVGAPAEGAMRTRSLAPTRSWASAASPMTSAYHGSRSGCGCGGHGGHASSCGCGCGGGRSRMFPPARYDDDGECVPVTDISCETRWRVRECFKVALCDMLRCMGEELCEDGAFTEEPDIGRCVESFVCSLLDCLPEAICPPPPKVSCCVPDPCGTPEPCCTPRPQIACHCNFAVGE